MRVEEVGAAGGDRTRPRVRIAVLLGAAVATSCLRALVDAPWTAPAALVVSFLFVASAWRVALRRRARPYDLWRWLAAGASAWWLADAVRAALPRCIPGTGLCAADVPLLLGHGIVAYGLSKLAHRRAPHRASGAILDGCVIATTVGMTAWLVLLQPRVAEHAGTLAQLVLESYVMSALVLCTAAAWLVVLPGEGGRALAALLGFLGTRLAGDVLVIVAAGGGVAAPDHALDALSPVVFAMLLVAIADEDATELAAPRSVAVDRLDGRRFAVLSAALMVAPVLAVTAQLLDPDHPHVVYLGGAILVSGLITRRLVVLGRERARAIEALAHRSTHDPLTGLPNRALLLDRIDQGLRRARRDGRYLGLCHVDLDRFKAINDSRGHDVGDRLLREVAARLVSTVGASGTVARLAGDEFAVVCDDLESSSTIFSVADRILRAIDMPFQVGSGSALVSASIGVAVAPERDETAEELLRHADAAMYRAKHAGRARWEVFDAELQCWVHARRSAETDLDRALRDGEFRLVYQPIVDLLTNEVNGFEALLRWDRPGHGLVSPERFIGTAEETGLIVPIGEWVIEEAIRQIASWTRGTARPRPCHMSVNVSARQLGQPHLAEFVARAVRNAGIDPSCLVLEITESVLIDDAARAIEQLHALERVGVRLALDDFGTGYSGLSYLRRLPVHLVKIDRSFVSRVTETPADAAVVSAIVTLSHALGLTPVAEGVETAAQRAVLERLGCNLGQGYLWSKPVAPRDAIRLTSAPLAVRAQVGPASASTSTSTSSVRPVTCNT